MGLPAINGISYPPTCQLFPDAVVLSLKKRHPGFQEALQLLMDITSERLLKATKKNRLPGFYQDLSLALNSEPVIFRRLDRHQIDVSINRCLSGWLIEVESAISDWQHSGQDDRPFNFAVKGEIRALTLSQISRLRNRLYKVLELPLTISVNRPRYEGR